MVFRGDTTSYELMALGLPVYNLTNDSVPGHTG
jgi:hypothetical protein